LTIPDPRVRPLLRPRFSGLVQRFLGSAIKFDEVMDGLHEIWWIWFDALSAGEYGNDVASYFFALTA
jgi:hypothetical protein